jgi:hypothetical protein
MLFAVEHVGARALNDGLRDRKGGAGCQIKENGYGVTYCGNLVFRRQNYALTVADGFIAKPGDCSINVKEGTCRYFSLIRNILGYVCPPCPFINVMTKQCKIMLDCVIQGTNIIPGVEMSEAVAEPRMGDPSVTRQIRRIFQALARFLQVGWDEEMA